MNTKKILILGLILVLVGSTITAISAEDSTSSKSTSDTITFINGNLTIDGINFKIPDNFEEVDVDIDTDDDNDDGEDIDGNHVDSTMSDEFKDENNNVIECKVGNKANNEQITEINVANAEKKTINDKEGYFFKDGDKFAFEYLQDGKIVKVKATTEDLINQVII